MSHYHHYDHLSMAAEGGFVSDLQPYTATAFEWMETDSSTTVLAAYPCYNSNSDSDKSKHSDFQLQFNEQVHSFASCSTSCTATSFLFNGEYSSLPDAFRNSRYMSPTGCFGGSLSESSSPSEYTLSPEITRMPLPAYNDLTTTSQLPMMVLDFSSNSNMPWQPVDQNPYTASSPFNFTSTFNQMPTRGCILEEIEPETPTPLVVDDSKYSRYDTIRIDASGTTRNPVELSLSEDLVSVNSSDRVFSIDSASSATTEGWSGEEDEAEDENEDDRTAPARDNDSDSDYQTASRRQVAARSQALRTSKRTHSHTAQTVLAPNARVNKSSRASVKHKKSRGPFSSSRVPQVPDRSERFFPCTFRAFGCSAEFANKNEWKRHVASQHLQLGYFRCDLGSCNPETNGSGLDVRRGGHNKRDVVSLSYNDFNRKDLFTQHCRRMHGPARTAPSKKPPSKAEEEAFEKELDDIRQRCWRTRRQAPARSSCGFCGRLFEATVGGPSGSAEEKAWEERMEHVGRHYEKDNIDLESENVDDDLVDWGLNNGVMRIVEDRPWLVNASTAALQTRSAPRSGQCKSRGQENGPTLGTRRGTRRRTTTNRGVSALQPASIVETASRTRQRVNVPKVKHDKDEIDRDSDMDAEGDDE